MADFESGSPDQPNAGGEEADAGTVTPGEIIEGEVAVSEQVGETVVGNVIEMPPVYGPHGNPDGEAAKQAAFQQELRDKT